MDKTVFASKIKELCDLSNRLHSFEEDEESFLAAIKNLDRPYLQIEAERFRENSIGWDKVLKPVNFIKFLVIDKILAGNDLTLADISALKEEVLKRDTDYFKDYPDFKDAMLKLEEGKNFFRQWASVFRILFYVYYNQYKDKISELLTEISEHLKISLNMKDAKTTVNGFGWNNNYGGSDCWIALYPSTSSSHQKAYQIFLKINPDNKVVYGMTTGEKVEKKERKLEEQDGSSIDLQNLEKFMFDEAKPLYEKMNAEISFIKEEADSKDETHQKVNEKQPKNVILYGPPGTGKTYEAYEDAVKIVEPGFKPKDRKELIVKFKELQGNGLITFITFHQSYSYEEFIEGFRYNEISRIPEVESGVFKTLVESARTDYYEVPKNKTTIDFSKSDVFKMSLGNTLQGDDDIYQYCVDNNVIALGWGQSIDYSKADSKEMVEKLFTENSKEDDESAFNITAVDYFRNIIKKGDLIFVSKGNRSLRAIGKVTGDYLYNKDAPIRYRHFRKVEWLLTDVNVPVEKVMKKNFSQQTIYSIRKQWLNEVNLAELLKTPNKEKKEIRNYVLIIDEINRGNLSRIFGEIITLVEDDKRLGMENELMVKLPYSQEPDFGIPPNIYIIGTMNTADRSIALMDVALRRRFSFRKVSPQSKVIYDDFLKKEVNEEFIEIVQKTFVVLNKRIKALLDEDHMIGHSYFLKIGAEDSEYDLHAVWYDKIIPLLQEYFYNDWDKLKLVLGEFDATGKKGFVKSLESEFEGVFCEEFDDDYPSEIAYHSADNFSQILKNTFNR